MTFGPPSERRQRPALGRAQGYATSGAWGLLLIVGLLLGGVPSRADTRFSDSVVVTRVVDDDLYAAGGEIRIEGSVAGAAVLGAGSVTITGDVEGDAILAGGRVTLEGGVGDDLRAAGGTVRITGFVTDQATVAGGSVTVGPGSAIGGRTWIAGGDVDVAGQIGDDLGVAAGTVVISGRVVGDVEVAAREIRIEPGAVIGGDLVWRSERAPQIAEDVQILGDVRRAGSDDTEQDVREVASRSGGGWTMGLAVAAAALVLLWCAPRLAARSATAFRAAPARTLGLGLASLVLTPIVAAVLFVTVLGWLLGLVVLAGYVFAMLLSGLIGLLIVAHLLHRRLGAASPGPQGGVPSGAWRTVPALLAIVVALVLAQRIPMLGGLFTVFLVLAGLGALTALVTGRASPEARQGRPNEDRPS